MFLAITTDDRRIMATRDEPGFCPGCGGQLVAKLGDIYVWHWAHKPNHSCAYDRITTYWQYEWMAYYHSLGWEVETTVNGYHFHAIHRETQKALMLATKLAREDWEEFIKAASSEGLKPHIVFSPKVFQTFSLIEHRFKSTRKSNNLWTFFWKHAQKGQKQTASLYLDIEAKMGLDFNLRTGMYRLSYDGAYSSDIIVSPTPITKLMKPKASLRARE